MQQHTPPHLLALDLEGTLISDAHSRIPRPGLFQFLEGCAELFPRIVAFTAVNEEDFRIIVRQLAADGDAPSWFADIEYIHWRGRGAIKNLAFIPGIQPHEALLVDDFAEFVHPDQRAQFVKAEHFGHPYNECDYNECDTELSRLLPLLKARMLPCRPG